MTCLLDGYFFSQSTDRTGHDFGTGCSAGRSLNHCFGIAVTAGRRIDSRRNHCKVGFFDGSSAGNLCNRFIGVGIVAVEGGGDYVGVFAGSKPAKCGSIVDTASIEDILVVCDGIAAACDRITGNAKAGVNVHSCLSDDVVGGGDGAGNEEVIALHMGVGNIIIRDLDVVVGFFQEFYSACIDVTSLTIAGLYLIPDVVTGILVKTSGGKGSTNCDSFQIDRCIAGFLAAGFAADISVFDNLDLDTGGVEGTLIEIGFFLHFGFVAVKTITSIYYEDNFLALDVDGTDTSTGWTGAFTDPAIRDFSEVVQHEDRVGNGHIYGSDEAYENSAMYSMGAAQHITVNPNRTGRAEFRFWGTGFDVISLTSSDTGTILVRIYQLDENGQPIDNQISDADLDPYKAYFVDTYYGYTYNKETQKWEVREGASDSLYQVPVIKADLPYGHYKAVLSISYAPLFDHKDKDADNGSYDFYLDAIRIYNPAGQDPADVDIKNAYIADHEYKPVFQELRDLLISVNDFNTANDVVDGAIFIDGIPSLSGNQNSGNVGTSGKTPAVADYMNYGPNNELYLAKGQAVAFTLNKSDADQVHIAMKSVGGSAKVKIYAAASNVDVDALPEITISSATDLYRSISEFKDGSTVVIYNSGDEETDAILSVTNIKTTYHESGSGEDSQNFSIRKEDVAMVLNSLTPAAEIPVLTPTCPSLDFSEIIRYNIYFNVDNGESVVEMGLLSWYAKPEAISYQTAEYVTSGYYANENGTYMVRSQGIPAKQMADNLYMAVYAKLSDGTYAYSNLCVYHAKYYAEDILATSSNDNMKALCVALLNYGAAAQIHFNYKTDCLMNADLTEAQKELVDAYAPSMITPVHMVDTDKASNFAPVSGSFLSAYPSVSFEGAFAINYYFVPSAQVSEMTFYAWNEEVYRSADKLTVDNASKVTVMTNENGTFTAAYTDIAGRQIDETIYVCAVYELDGVQYCTGVLAYSIGAYCLDRIENSSGTMKNLAEFTAVYGFYAKQYFASV